jgi:hypothetical protein
LSGRSASRRCPCAWSRQCTRGGGTRTQSICRRLSVSELIPCVRCVTAAQCGRPPAPHQLERLLRPRRARVERLTALRVHLSRVATARCRCSILRHAVLQLFGEASLRVRTGWHRHTAWSIQHALACGGTVAKSKEKCSREKEQGKRLFWNSAKALESRRFLSRSLPLRHPHRSNRSSSPVLLAQAFAVSCSLKPCRTKRRQCYTCTRLTHSLLSVTIGSGADRYNKTNGLPPLSFSAKIENLKRTCATGLLELLRRPIEAWCENEETHPSAAIATAATNSALPPIVGWAERKWPPFYGGKRARRRRENAALVNDASKHQAGRHIRTASNDMLLIYEGDAEVDAASAVACFKAPQPISSVRCNGSNIFVGCDGGAVCILHAPFLAA